MYGLDEEQLEELGIVDDVSAEVKCRCEDGCECIVEWDGKCHHGCVSKVRAMGMI